MSRTLPDFVVVVDKHGVHTTPRIGMVEAQLSVLTRRFANNDDSWRLVVSPDGSVKEINGFDGMDLRLGEVVGRAVLEFMSLVDPFGNNELVIATEALAEVIVSDGLADQINWDRVEYRHPHPYEGMVGFVGSPQRGMMILPGAPEGQYRHDVNVYIREVFKSHLEVSRRRDLVASFLVSSVKLLKLREELIKSELPAPENLGEFLDRVRVAMPEDIGQIFSFAEKLEQLLATLFPGVFPELDVKYVSKPKNEQPSTPEARPGADSDHGGALD